MSNNLSYRSTSSTYYMQLKMQINIAQIIDLYRQQIYFIVMCTYVHLKHMFYFPRLSIKIIFIQLEDWWYNDFIICTYTYKIIRAIALNMHSWLRKKSPRQSAMSIITTRSASRIARCETSKLIEIRWSIVCLPLWKSARVLLLHLLPPCSQDNKELSRMPVWLDAHTIFDWFQLTLSYCQPRESRSGPAPSRRSAPPNSARSPPPPPRRSHRNPPSPLRIRRFPRTWKAYSI